jgi:hypothetical protein
MATKRPKSTRNCPQTGPFNINFRSNLITKSKIRQKLTFLVAQVAKWCSTPQKTPNFAEHWRAKPPRLATNEESPDSKEQRTGEEPGGFTTNQQIVPQKITVSFLEMRVKTWGKSPRPTRATGLAGKPCVL